MPERLTTTVATLCRTAAVTMLAGLVPRLTAEEIEERLLARPRRERAAIVGATLLALFLLAVLAAQFGWIGMLVFWMAVIVVAR
jgi:hypothetical protein